MAVTTVAETMGGTSFRHHARRDRGFPQNPSHKDSAENSTVTVFQSDHTKTETKVKLIPMMTGSPLPRRKTGYIWSREPMPAMIMAAWTTAPASEARHLYHARHDKDRCDICHKHGKNMLETERHRFADRYLPIRFINRICIHYGLLSGT